MRDPVSAVGELVSVTAMVRAGAVADGDAEMLAVADELEAMVTPVVVALVFFEHAGRHRVPPDAAQVARALASKLGSRRAARLAVAAVLAELEAAA
jgi:hypothetical protein